MFTFARDGAAANANSHLGRGCALLVMLLKRLHVRSDAWDWPQHHRGRRTWGSSAGVSPRRKGTPPEGRARVRATPGLRRAILEGRGSARAEGTAR